MNDAPQRSSSGIEAARAYVERAIASYAGDPADNQFQKGFLAALEVVRDEAFPPREKCPHCLGSCNPFPEGSGYCEKCQGTGWAQPVGVAQASPARGKSDLADKIDLHLSLEDGSPGFHLSSDDFHEIAAALRRSTALQPLTKGATYGLGRFGLGEYLGIDVYHGETTHKFKTSDGIRHIKPEALPGLGASSVPSTHQSPPVFKAAQSAESDPVVRPDCAGGETYIWPAGCHSPNSCHRNKRCMYVGCRHDGTDAMTSTPRAAGEG